MSEGTNDSADAKLKRPVAIWNDSGGVGKTTVAVNVADMLAHQGHDVLVMDLDPQNAGLTDHVGFEDAIQHPEFDLMSTLLVDGQSLQDHVLRAEDHGSPFDVIPTHESLEHFDTKIAKNRGIGDGSTKLVLRENIIDAGLHEEYDYILMDCRATRGSLITNAVAAALNVMIPTEASRKGRRSVDGLVSFIENEQRELREIDSPYLPPEPTTGVVAVVPNMVAKNGQFTTDEKENLRLLLDEHGQRMGNFALQHVAGFKDSWTEQATLREFAGFDHTRDERSNEGLLLEQFEVLAESVKTASIAKVDDSHVANLPDEVYPEKDEEDEVLAS